MIPVEFPEQTYVLGRPKGVSAEECNPLPVYSDGVRCVSCWELSEEEKAEVLRTGKIYLSIWSGSTHHPVMLCTESQVPAMVPPARRG